MRLGPVLILVGLVSILTACHADEPEIVADSPCTRSVVQFDVSSVEKLILEPENVLEDIEGFWQTDPAYRLVNKWHMANEQPRDLDDWQERIERLRDLSPAERERHPQLDAARELARTEQSFVADAVPYLCSFLPPEADLSTTLFFAAEILPAGIQVDDGIVIHILNHELLNMFVHEVFHRGHTSIDPLPEKEQGRTDQRLRMYDSIRREGIATYVGYKGRKRFPQIGKVDRSLVAGDYRLLKKKSEVRRLHAELAELLHQASQMKPENLRKQAWELGVKQRAYYVVGAFMARTIDENLGRETLIETLSAGPSAFVTTYNGTADESMIVPAM